MLNYHKIHPQPTKTTTAIFNHFLTLGSHNTIINIAPLVSLSEVLIYADTKFVINQEKSQAGVMHVLVPLTGGLRVDEMVYGKGGVVFGGKFVHEVENQQTKFLYVEYHNQSNEPHPETTSLLYKQLPLNSQLSLKQINLYQNQPIQLNKRILLYIISGKIKISSTNQQFEEGECLYTKKGCGQIQAIQQSSIILFEFKDKQQV